MTVHQYDIARRLLALLLAFGLLSLLSCSDDNNPVNGGEDTTPPTVISTIPTDGDRTFAITRSIRAVFSEWLDSLTIDTAVFKLNPSTSGSVRFGGDVLTFVPTRPLDTNTFYTATITSQVRDTAGNALRSDYTWEFATFEDTIPPEVVSTEPQNGAEMVSITTQISVLFSEDIDTVSLLPSFLL